MALLVAALAGRAASAVKHAAEKTRLVPVLKLMTNASTRPDGIKTFKKAFRSRDIMPHTATLICLPHHNLGSGDRGDGAPTDTNI